MKVLVVTGGDDYFGALMLDCVASLRAVGYKGDVAVLDFGVAAERLAAMQEKGAIIRAGKVPEPYLSMQQDGTLVGAAGAGVLLLKPYLPELFPGYDRYVFIDADCWFQTATALDALIDHADAGDLAAVSQRSRFHDWDFARGNGVEFNAFGQPLRRNWYTMFANSSRLPKADKKMLAEVSIINAGVFAAASASPIWSRWQEEMLAAVKALPKRRKYGADQLGLGMAVYRHGLKPVLLPEICNWTSVWRYDAEQHLFTETEPFHAPVSIVHLAGIRPDDLTQTVQLADGSEAQIDLSYRGWCARRGVQE